MQNHRNHSSSFQISRQSSTHQLTQPDQLYYFRLGRQRHRLKNYVQTQLDSEQIRNNQKILLRFQQEAAQRRHHYLPKFTYQKENSKQKRDIRYQHKQIPSNITQIPSNITQIPSIINHQTVLPSHIVACKSKFSSYVPKDYEVGRQYQIPPLVPTQKTKPPVYHYHNLLPYRHFDDQASYNYHSKTVQLPIKKSEITIQKQLLKAHPQYSRAMSIQMNPVLKENHNVWALKKIKQAVIKKKRQKGKEREDTERSSGSILVARLEKRRVQKIVECEQLQKHLKKLKKYRRLIGQHQNQLKRL